MQTRVIPVKTPSPSLPQCGELMPPVATAEAQAFRRNTPRGAARAGVLSVSRLTGGNALGTRDLYS